VYASEEAEALQDDLIECGHLLDGDGTLANASPERLIFAELTAREAR